METMTLEEQKQVLIDYYVNLLRIKKSESGRNKEPEGYYSQPKCACTAHLRRNTLGFSGVLPIARDFKWQNPLLSQAERL